MIRSITEFAPAKINLTLHVTGRRGDGLHLLDSLVVFADIGDRLKMTPAPETRLSVRGPMAAGVPTDACNLVLRAAALMGQSARFDLDKQLPVAAGIGGGSSDAAAAIRALRRYFDADMPDVAALGADLPVCLQARSARMRGIGEEVTPVPVPPLPAVLVNPGVAVSTARVFAALRGHDGAGMPEMPIFVAVSDCAAWLSGQRNDLEAPARALVPEIGQALIALAGSGALLTRMSGSGATCFGLFRDQRSAARAAADIARAMPGWWVRPTLLAVD
jgi:4-diphosphocytidyl-2-C-methyl-D-erythritol kinase